MAYNKRFSGENTREKNVNCSCGGKAKLSSRKNYPFGKKSKSLTFFFYKCKSCGNIKPLNDTREVKR